MCIRDRYYTGMRVGELCTLTPAYVDLKNNTSAISKTFQRINGKDGVWAPKTPKSNRVITIPQTLAAVSYTHLDVYKRQDISLTGFQLFIPCLCGF